MKILKLISLLLFLPLLSFNQEVITDLSVNYKKRERINSFNTRDKSEKSVYILLPFKDDFSKENTYPDENLWLDKYAFINNTYPINPITVGVATLDALNDSGMIYSLANTSSFKADFLTSQKVRLDSILQGSNLVPLKIGDSIYFSFYYQPQGIGNKPEGHDSIGLEFYSPTDSLWHFIWNDAGQSHQSFVSMYGVDFKQVLIPITDSLKFFHKDFQFRFYNLASIANTYEPSWAGNVDQWHLDYIYLNSNRNFSDTIYEDVAFTTKPNSLLTKYQSVPWPHYSSSVQMNNTEVLPYINLSSITKNVSRNFSIIDLFDNSIPFSYSGGNLNLPALTSETFTTPISYTYSSLSTDTALFELRSIINTTPDINRNNDTIRFYQRFYNYYAYDDGSPENGYGLTTNDAQLAYKFTALVSDTLKAIQMFFNQTFENANAKYFTLRVWTGNTEPQNIVYEKSGMLPIFEDELNKYHTYFLDTTLVLSGNFFVGWKQTTGDNLNIGYDRNTNSKENIFYNVNGTWMNSIYDGSLMIRPVFGKTFNAFVNQINPKEKIEFSIYPNPSSGVLNFKPNTSDFEGFENYTIHFVDLMGKTCFQSELQEKINIPSHYANGIYFYTISYKKSSAIIDAGKFILSK